MGDAIERMKGLTAQAPRHLLIFAPLRLGGCISSDFTTKGAESR
jgi:hypothetical protein